MILEEETFEKFGYYPSDLTPKSRKRILAKCDGCGKIRELYRQGYHSLCKSCVKKGARHPLFGKHHSEKSKQKIRGENNPRWKGGKVKRICGVCGVVFEVDPCIIKYGFGKFCSHSCVRKGRKGFPQHHTKPERIFKEICKKNNLPFKYVGDSSFWIGKKPSVNPDFVESNGKKIAIEIFSYWHDPLRRHCKVPYSQTYEGRKKILKKYGWKLTVFWQEDLEREDADQFILNELQKHGVT